MSIRIKLAETEQELSDVYRLRYQVYSELGRFAEEYDDAIVDVFDAIPSVANIIAYSDDVPIATIRVNLDTALKLPSDHTFDFTPYRERIAAEEQAAGRSQPVFASAGMLAIAAEWRNRRNVFAGLLRMAVDIGHMLGVTHIVATVNDETAGIYERLGWERLSSPVPMGDFGVNISPFATPMASMYRWAFGMFREKKDLLEQFSGCFTWYLVDKGTKIFSQGEPGDEAYLITTGGVDITCFHEAADKTLYLARLGPGDMFGELSLIDSSERSATAVASRNTELIVINRDVFWEKSYEDPTRLKDLMQVLAARLRDANNLSMIYAYASLHERLSYFVEMLRRTAVEDVRNPDILRSKMTVHEFADMSRASLEEAERFLDKLQAENKLEYSKHQITFFEGRDS